MTIEQIVLRDIASVDMICGDRIMVIWRAIADFPVVENKALSSTVFIVKSFLNQFHFVERYKECR